MDGPAIRLQTLITSVHLTNLGGQSRASLSNLPKCVLFSEIIIVRFYSKQKTRTQQVRGEPLRMWRRTIRFGVLKHLVGCIYIYILYTFCLSSPRINLCALIVGKDLYVGCADGTLIRCTLRSDGPSTVC